MDRNIIPRLENEELRVLFSKRWLRPTIGLVRVFSLLVLIICSSILINKWYVYVAAFVLIGALQHAMSILQHESVHSLLFPSKKLNDFIGNYFLSYTIGFSLDYRYIHLNHHKYLGTDMDPDESNYKDFPNTKKAFVKKIVTEFSGIGAVKQFLSSGSTSSSRRSYSLVGIIITQLIIFSLFFIFSNFIFYFILWLFPLVTVAKGLSQTRNLAEHLVRIDAPSGAERLRTFKSNAVERFFFAPLNFNYHAEHHWYPMVPYYNLPRLRSLLKSRDGYNNGAEWCDSYFTAIKHSII